MNRAGGKSELTKQVKTAPVISSRRVCGSEKHGTEELIHDNMVMWSQSQMPLNSKWARIVAVILSHMTACYSSWSEFWLVARRQVSPWSFSNLIAVWVL